MSLVPSALLNALKAMVELCKAGGVQVGAIDAVLPSPSAPAPVPTPNVPVAGLTTPSNAPTEQPTNAATATATVTAPALNAPKPVNVENVNVNFSASSPPVATGPAANRAKAAASKSNRSRNDTVLTPKKGGLSKFMKNLINKTRKAKTTPNFTPLPEEEDEEEDKSNSASLLKSVLNKPEEGTIRENMGVKTGGRRNQTQRKKNKSKSV